MNDECEEDAPRKGAAPAARYLGGPAGTRLTYGETDSTLLQMFEPHRAVQSAPVIMDRDTGRSKGSASWRWVATKRPRLSGV
jgi:hypothetical protein